MTDCSDYVHCGEVFKSSILSNEKSYLIKCIKCQDLFQLETFLTHSKQNLCKLREITINEEVLDGGCLRGCPKSDKHEGINSNGSDEIGKNQDSLVFNKYDDVSNADEIHCGEVFRSSILSNENLYLFKCIKCRDLFQLEAFLTHSKQNVCELHEITIKEEVLDDGCLSSCHENDKNEGINVNSIDKVEVNQVCCLNKDSLVFIKEEDVSNAAEKGHVRYKIESSDAEVDAEQQEFETDDDFDLDDNKYDSENVKGQAQRSHHLTVLSLVTLSPNLPSLLHEQIVQILKIYENLPHLWNSSLIEHRCKNKRYESEMELIKRIEGSLGYEIDCETLNYYLRNIHLYFSQEKRKRLNDEHLDNSSLYQHLVFLFDHVGPFRCSQCDFENQNIYLYKVHLSQHDGSMPFKCSQCGKEFENTRPYYNHARIHLKDFKYICQLCGTKFLNSYTLKVHMSSHTNVRDCICKTCGKAFKTKDTLKRHEILHSDVRKYICTVCNKKFNRGYMLTRHMRNHVRNLSDEITTTSEEKMADTEIIVKDNLNKIKIESSDAEVDGDQQEFETDVSLDDDFDLDDDKYDSENAKGQAQRSHHLAVLSLATLGPHLPSLLHEQIVQILKIYENLPHLWNTSLIEHRGKNKRCESEMEMIKRIEESLGYEIDCETLNNYLKKIQCYVIQEKSRKLNNEHLENSGLYQHSVFLFDHVGPFRCSQCDFENQSIYLYKVHLSQHDGSMPFKCSQCGKEFKNTRPYYNHARIHLKDFKHICQVCGKNFITPSHLKMHMHTHTNVRECICCKACGKEFTTKHHLKIHEVTHSDLRKYVCTICSKSFKLGFKLTQHMRTHSSNFSNENMTRSEDKMADTEIIVKDSLDENL